MNTSLTYSILPHCTHQVHNFQHSHHPGLFLLKKKTSCKHVSFCKSLLSGRTATAWNAFNTLEMTGKIIQKKKSKGEKKFFKYWVKMEMEESASTVFCSTPYCLSNFCSIYLSEHEESENDNSMDGAQETTSRLTEKDYKERFLTSSHLPVSPCSCGTTEFGQILVSDPTRHTQRKHCTAFQTHPLPIGVQFGSQQLWQL